MKLCAQCLLKVSSRIAKGKIRVRTFLEMHAKFIDWTNLRTVYTLKVADGSVGK